MYAGQKQLACPISLYKVKPCWRSSSSHGLAEWLRKTKVKVTGNRKWCGFLTSQPLPLPCFPRVGTSPPRHLPLPLGWQSCHPVSGFLHASCPSCIHSTCSPNSSLGLSPTVCLPGLICQCPSHAPCPASSVRLPVHTCGLCLPPLLFVQALTLSPVLTDCSPSGLSLPACLSIHFRQGQLALSLKGRCAFGSLISPWQLPVFTPNYTTPCSCGSAGSLTSPASVPAFITGVVLAHPLPIP